MRTSTTDAVALAAAAAPLTSFQMMCFSALRAACGLWCRYTSLAAGPGAPSSAASRPRQYLAHHDTGASCPVAPAGGRRAFQGAREVSSPWGWAWLMRAAGVPPVSPHPTVYEHAVRRASDGARIVLLSSSPEPPASVPAVSPHKVLYAELRVGPRQPSKRVTDVSPFVNARIESFHGAPAGRITLRQLVGVLRAHKFAGGDPALPLVDDPGMRLVVTLHDLVERAFHGDDELAW